MWLELLLHAVIVLVDAMRSDPAGASIPGKPPRYSVHDDTDLKLHIKHTSQKVLKDAAKFA